MATLDNKSIRGTLSAAFGYNNNPGKNIPPDGLSAAHAYIHGEHSVERLYSRGHNGCSSNPKLAIQQFRACEALYRRNKGGAKEAGLAEGKQPIIAEHFFLSFPNKEFVSYQTQCEIADRLCSSEILSDFYAVSNRHWNTDNDHSHLLVCNFNKTGTKKLSMNNTKRNALRKELDRICVEYGLSIVDDPALRWNDPEREAFVRSCVGKVDVYAPADYEKQLNSEREYDRWMLEQIRAGRVKVAKGVSFNRAWDEERQKYHGTTQAEAYQKWIASQECFIREKDKKAAKKREAMFVSEEEAKTSQIARAYYWDPKYKSSQYPGYYYAIRRYDKFGYHKPLLLLVLELIMTVASNEERYYFERYPHALNPKKDWATQNVMDTLRYQREQGVRTPAELDSRIKAVGTDLAEARKGLAYYQNAITKGDDLHKAIRTFNTMVLREEKNGSLTEEEQMIYKEAYRIMAAHKCTEPLQIADFLNRRHFAENKVKDLEERIPRLKKDYHDLKFIESHSAECVARIEQYAFYNSADTHSLDDILQRANRAEGRFQATSKEKEKFSEKF